MAATFAAIRETISKPVQGYKKGIHGLFTVTEIMPQFVR